ncbi:hypothetical protein EDD86DRAFT_256295 [Gorgonomyces haynaldii]|nr:hypothetical protein EDD86DRAFT_256295 [Gorgonomyces haynaldii]
MAAVTQFGSLPHSFFEFDEYLSTYIHMLICLFGVVVSVIILASTIRTICSPQTILILLLCWADLGLCLAGSVYSIWQLAQNSFDIGVIPCAIYSICDVFFAFLSLVTLLMITFERYNYVIRQKTLTLAQAWRTVGFLFLISFFVAVWPAMANQLQLYGLEPGKIVCALVFWDTTPIGLFQSLICMGLIFSCALVMIFCYAMIIRSYYVFKAQHKSTGSNLTSLKSAIDDGNELQKKSSISKKEERDLETRLLIKCILISGMYICCWCGYGIKAIVEIATQKPIPPVWDVIVTIPTSMNSAFNPVLLYVFDSKIKANVREMLGLPV